MKHTPGPWYVRRCSPYCPDDRACRISPDPASDLSWEGVVYDGNTEECGHVMSIEDARLIAAAPELAAALAGILKAFDDGAFVRNTDNDHMSDWAVKLLPYIKLLGDAKASLAKAGIE